MRRGGYAKLELLVVLAVIVVLTAIVVLVLGSERRNAADAHRLRQTHQAMVLFAGEHWDRYPIPGLIWRDLTGYDIGRMRFLPGSAPPEDVSKNTTANFYSALIARQYIPPDLLISPRERNPRVGRISSYDYDVYDPKANMHWDTNFKADLFDESHASYAHMLIHGARKRLRWRHTNDPNTPIMSNRGPAGGLPDAKSYTTRRDGTWAGFIVFGDNSVQWLDTVTPENVRYQPNIQAQLAEPEPDNIFAAEFHDDWMNPSAPLGSNDVYLTFTLKFEGKRGRGDPIVQHD